MNRMGFEVALAGMCLAASVLPAAIIDKGLSNDGAVAEDGTITVSSPPYYKPEAGFSSAGTSNGVSMVMVFPMPTLAAGTQFAPGANVQFQFDYLDGAVNYNLDLYGLGYRTSPAILATDAYRGTLDTTDATLIQDNILTPTSAKAWMMSSSITDYLNAQYVASAADRANGPVYVFLRLSPDGSARNWTWNGYQIVETESTWAVPQISYDTAPVPEPGTASLLALALAGGLCTRRTRKSQVK